EGRSGKMEKGHHRGKSPADRRGTADRGCDATHLLYPETRWGRRPQKRQPQPRGCAVRMSNKNRTSWARARLLHCGIPAPSMTAMGHKRTTDLRAASVLAVLRLMISSTSVRWFSEALACCWLTAEEHKTQEGHKTTARSTPVRYSACVTHTLGCRARVARRRAGPVTPSQLN